MRAELASPLAVLHNRFVRTSSYTADKHLALRTVALYVDVRLSGVVIVISGRGLSLTTSIDMMTNICD